jgi:hypothetical protein
VPGLFSIEPVLFGALHTGFRARDVHAELDHPRSHAIRARGVANGKAMANDRKSCFLGDQQRTCEPTRLLLHFLVPDPHAGYIKRRVRLVEEQSVGKFVSQIARLTPHAVGVIKYDESLVAVENSHGRKSGPVDLQEAPCRIASLA